MTRRSDVADAAFIPSELVAGLLGWSDANLRDLPWRRTRDPWSILVSEVMLQQTQVSRVLQRHREFMARFPTPAACAASPVSAVIEMWAGLGYNRRAVNLWKSAGAITEQHDGRMPDELDALLALPGVGPYTARAVLAFAFEHDVGVVDTNVGRLLARWSGQTLTPRRAQRTADTLVPSGAGWQWNQALFDFAVAICTKRNPSCGDCGLRELCQWRGDGPDPADASAAVSGPQSRFAGSQRQVRGRLVAALRRGPIPLDQLEDFGRDTDSADDVRRIAQGLVGDGLATEIDGQLRLPTGDE